MKTRDGIKLTQILSALEEITELTIRQGTKHPYMLGYKQLRPCPLAESTDTKHMLIPWLKQVDELKSYDKQTIYLGLKQGRIIEYARTYK